MTFKEKRIIVTHKKGKSLFFYFLSEKTILLAFLWLQWFSCPVFPCYAVKRSLILTNIQILNIGKTM
jgi:hypothetical protein